MEDKMNGKREIKSNLSVNFAIDKELTQQDIKKAVAEAKARRVETIANGLVRFFCKLFMLLLRNGKKKNSNNLEYLRDR